MGEIVESRRRHYVGVDADKASIPAGGKSPGDSYHANDKGKQYYWDGANWKTGLGYEFVPRPLSAWDWTEATLTLDGTWKVDGLDTTAIVPAGAVAIVFLASIIDNAIGTRFRIRQSVGDSSEVLFLETLVANQPGPNVFSIVPCDADRLLDYHGVAGTDSLDLAIIGYFI